jgi:hypothetical protein
LRGHRALDRYPYSSVFKFGLGVFIAQYVVIDDDIREFLLATKGKYFARPKYVGYFYGPASLNAVILLRFEGDLTAFSIRASSYTTIIVV